MTVRRAKPDDAEAIARVQLRGWQVAYAHFIDPAQFQDWTVATGTERWRGIIDSRGPSTTIVSVAADGTVAGFASYGPARKPAAEGELWAIYVDAEVQRGGHGSALITTATDALRAAGHRDAYLEVFEPNLQARAFYERHGWVPDGNGPREHPWAPELRYVREL